MAHIYIIRADHILFIKSTREIRDWSRTSLFHLNKLPTFTLSLNFMANSDSTSTVEAAPLLSTEPRPDQSWKVSLDEKVIAITGANQGIGLGIAEVCLANSASIVYSLDVKEPAEAFEGLRQKHKNLRYIETDITNKGSVDRAIEGIYTNEGRLDGFVANAGMTKHQPALDFNEEQLHEIFELNVGLETSIEYFIYSPFQVFGTYHCATSVARKWIEDNTRGSIVFTASMASYRPNRAAPSAPYGGTKAAIRNMAHTLAMEWAHHGIRVNSVSPGFVRTQMTTYMEGSPDWDLKLKYYGGIPRLADPKELGGAYVYLLSDAASYTTGIDIPVAGIVGAW
ncbi:MAG: hypothetical protein Q9166_000970 [cf. Caloplaca sp. 2 TL-2023]